MRERLKTPIMLVGNGPSVLDSSLGTQIDAFDHIVRFNNYQTKGYEKHVGKRTTIWSRWYALPHAKPMNTFEEIWINMPLQERSPDKVEAGLAYTAEHRSRARIIPGQGSALRLQEKVYGTCTGSKWPSSGLLAIAHALDVAPVVYLVGFDSWNREPFHYFEEHERSNTHHIAEIERAHIEELRDTGRLSFLQ